MSMPVKLLVIAMLTVGAMLSAAAIEAQPAPEVFNGTIYDAGQVSRGTATFFTLQVDRWGNEEESLRYRQILKEKGQQGLLDAFRDSEPVGFIRVGEQLGYPIVFARVIPATDGRVVRAFTDRPVQFFELRNNLRSLDYPFGIVEIQFFDKDKGKGEGTLVAAASAKFTDKGQLEIEQMGTTPFKLLNMKAAPVKEKKK